MASLMYESSAITFARMLGNLSALLDKADAYAAEKKIDTEVLAQARLYPDMFPLYAQVGLAASFAKNVVCRIAGETPPDFPMDGKTMADARALLKRAQDIIAAIKPEAFDGAEARTVTFNVAPNTPKTMSSADYLNKFGLPHFYFHVVTAYDILRHNGVSVGKREYIGSLD
jgi:hypothetical protein